MARGGALYIALILQCIAVSLAADQNPVPVFISEIGTFLRTEHDAEKESSVFACVQRCVAKSGCKSINYKRQGGGGHNCFLNKKNRREAGEEAIESDKNFVHYDIDYHVQRSEEPEFGTADINVPPVPPLKTAGNSSSGGLCDSNPCENGGTCVEFSAENRYECNCTDSFKGKRCNKPRSSGLCDTNPCQNGGTCVEITDGGKDKYQCNCTDTFTGNTCEQAVTNERGKGGPSSNNDYDFELVFQGTAVTSYLQFIKNKWFSHFSVCAWIFTPDIAENQRMTIFSIKTEKNNKPKVVRAQIDGQGGFYFSFGTDWSNHPRNFASTSSKDGWIFLCVRFRANNQPYMKTTVNKDFGNAYDASSNNVQFANTRITKIIIGQDQNSDGSLNTSHPFEGRMSVVNFWESFLNMDNTKDWYDNVVGSYYLPKYKWPQVGNPDNRFGDVRFVSVRSVGRNWRNVTQDELVIRKTSNVQVELKSDENGLLVEFNQVSSVLPDQCMTTGADAMLISVRGNWKRIKFQQKFLETQECYAIFGSVPSWFPSDITAPGVEEFDLNQDELWRETFLGVNVDQYSGANTLCDNTNFWEVNPSNGNTPVAGVSLRRESGATNAGISTYAKCGKFTFTISDISVLE